MIATSQANTFGPRREVGPDVVRPQRTAVPLDVRVRAATRLAAPVAVSGIAATLALLAWTTIAPASAEGAAFAPLLVGMVLLWLPHGALDPGDSVPAAS